jgi:hypothetical protein
MITAIFLTTMFISGLIFGVLLGAALATLGIRRNPYRAFDGGYSHNYPEVRTRVQGGGVESTKH